MLKKVIMVNCVEMSVIIFLMILICAFLIRGLADISFFLSFVSVGKINAVISFFKYFVFERFVLP